MGSITDLNVLPKKPKQKNHNEYKLMDLTQRYGYINIDQWPPLSRTHQETFNFFYCVVTSLSNCSSLKFACHVLKNHEKCLNNI